MSMQLAVKSKEKDMVGKENRAPQGGVRNIVDNLGAAINRGVAEITADNIGERLREGVQRHLREHALQREQATFGEVLNRRFLIAARRKKVQSHHDSACSSFVSNQVHIARP
jgi:hypothetical protein